MSERARASREVRAELLATDEDTRRKLEGRVELLEAGLQRYRWLDDALGRYDEAERLLTASSPVLLARFGETHWSSKIARDGLAELGRRRGRPVAMPAAVKSGE